MLPRTLRKIITIFLLILSGISATSASADDGKNLGLEFKQDEINSQFMLGVEMTGLNLGSSSLTGAGIHLAYEYGFNKNWSILPSFALVAALSGSSGYLYSSIDANFRYSLFGSLGTTQRKIIHDGKTIVSQTEERQNRFCLTAGLEQLFLNGTQAVYPASGITFGIAYLFPILNHWTEISIRDGQLTSGSRSVSTIIIDLSLAFAY